MSWIKVLETPLPGPDIETRLRSWLRREIPRFKAPTDVRSWRRQAPGIRRRALKQVFLRGYRDDTVTAVPAVEWVGDLAPCPEYHIRKLRYEIVPDYWVPALLYVPTGLSAPAPVVLNPNGHHAGGKACDYKQIRCANLARRGMIALNTEFIGMSELQADCHHNEQGFLSLTGQAGVGLFYLAMAKALDVLLAQPHADPKRVAMTGLSGGGWQTIVLSALDPRITVSVPVAGYTSLRARVNCLEDRGDLEQMPPDLATVCDYQTMTAMLAPRPTLQILNAKDDCCFRTHRARPVIHNAIRPTYAAFGAADVFACHSNTDPGTHNYDADNRHQLYAFLDRHFGITTAAADIHQPCDLYSEQALTVGLPASQQTVRGLALKRARSLAAARVAPTTARQRTALRRRLRQVLRLPEVSHRGRSVRVAGNRNRQATLWQFDSGAWAFAVASHAGAASATPILRVCDAGRTAAGDRAGRAPIYAADLLCTGEQRTMGTTALLVEAAGGRMLGAMVAQLLAAATFAHGREQRPLALEAHGTVSAFAGLLAAALQPALFTRLTVTWEVMRLEYLFSWPVAYDDVQPLCCPGLLEVADVPELLPLLEHVVFNPIGRCVPAATGGN
jgi:dienelactone hydrolase